MLPAPILPLAEHAAFGQNWCDASIGSGVLFCIRTSCRGPSIFSSLPFHRLVGSYHLYRAFPQIIKGPDFWTFFQKHQDLISDDDIHPTQMGFGAYRQQWANMMLKEVYPTFRRRVDGKKDFQ